MNIIMVLAMGALEMDEVWVHVIVALAHGCFGERMRSG